MVHIRPLNSIRAFFYFKSKNVLIGKNVNLSGFCLEINTAKKITIYDDCKFELSENSILTIGSNVVFSYGVILCCRNRVTIGNDVQIGEYTSIRDSTHDYSELGVPMKYNPDISREIIIGNNVWIGRNCLIMPGSIIEDGVVVGANSIVKGTLKKDCIYGGNPIKLLKPRVTKY
jgi:acetyltransferase-like isoleucine patch superfamily enzyme